MRLAVPSSWACMSPTAARRAPSLRTRSLWVHIPREAAAWHRTHRLPAPPRSSRRVRTSSTTGREAVRQTAATTKPDGKPTALYRRKRPSCSTRATRNRTPTAAWHSRGARTPRPRRPRTRGAPTPSRSRRLKGGASSPTSWRRGTSRRRSATAASRRAPRRAACASRRATAPRSSPRPPTWPWARRRRPRSARATRFSPWGTSPRRPRRTAAASPSPRTRRCPATAPQRSSPRATFEARWRPTTRPWTRTRPAGGAAGRGRGARAPSRFFSAS